VFIVFIFFVSTVNNEALFVDYRKEN